MTDQDCLDIRRNEMRGQKRVDGRVEPMIAFASAGLSTSSRCDLTFGIYVYGQLLDGG